MDIEKYRQPWESDEHWVFRKEFILTHRERFPDEDRLMCLAQVFANVELLGCTYPKPVMTQIKELSREIPQVQNLREKRSERTIVKFVKDTSEGTSRYAGKRNMTPADTREGPPAKLSHQSVKEYPTVGSANRMGAAALFNSESTEEHIASYYTVKGASQSHHQGETPLSPSVISYKSVQFVRPSPPTGGNDDMGERGSTSCTNVASKNPVKNVSQVLEINQKLLTDKFQNLSMFLIQQRAGGKGVQNSELLRIVCSKKSMKVLEYENININTCAKSCKNGNGFHCGLFIDDVLVGFAISTKKKFARRLAYDAAVKNLMEDDVEFASLVNWPEPKIILLTSVDYLEKMNLCPCFKKKLESKSQIKIPTTRELLPTLEQKIKIKEQPENPNLVNAYPDLEEKFGKMAVMKNMLQAENRPLNQLQLLEMICSKCAIMREYEDAPLPSNASNMNFTVSLNIENVLIGKAAGTSKKKARITACERALQLLSKKIFKVVPNVVGKTQLKVIASDYLDFKQCFEPFHPNLTSDQERQISSTMGKTSNVQKPWNMNSNEQIMKKAKLTNNQRINKQIKGFDSNKLTASQMYGNSQMNLRTGKAPNSVWNVSNMKIDRSNTKTEHRTLIIVDDKLVNNGSNEISILVHSCTICHVSISFDFSDEIVNKQLMKRCSITVGGKLEGFGVGETKQLSKLAACKNVIQNLQKSFYTVKVKKQVSSSAPQINKNQVQSTSTPNYETSEINSDNVGFKMMQLMGWKGGGIGKAEEGIEKPVSIQDVYNREGLGFDNANTPGILNKAFKANINKIVSHFAASNLSNELKFSPNFTKEDRKYIHSVADKYNLKAVSKGGQGTGRYLVLSHKLNPQQLVHHLLNSGGSNDKYTLIPPMGT